MSGQQLLEAMLERGATPGREAIVRFPRRRRFRCARRAWLSPAPPAAEVVQTT